MPSHRHHYIPKFYLRQWTGADEKLCEFSRPYERLIDRRKHPSETGYQDDLYTLGPEAGLNAQWIEDTFLKIADQAASDALQAIFAGAVTGQWNFTPKLRSGWSRFLMTLFSRTPDKIARLRQMQTEELAKIAADVDVAYDADHAKDAIPPTSEEKALAIRTERELGFARMLQTLMDLKDVGTAFNNMTWRVFGVENGRRNLLSSDRPVFLSRGVQHADSFLTLPISPSKLFVASNDQKFLARLGTQSPDVLIKASNEIVAKQAEKFVYATDTRQMQFVRNHFKM